MTLGQVRRSADETHGRGWATLTSFSHSLRGACPNNCSLAAVLSPGLGCRMLVKGARRGVGHRLIVLRSMRARA